MKIRTIGKIDVEKLKKDMETYVKRNVEVISVSGGSTRKT